VKIENDNTNYSPAELLTVALEIMNDLCPEGVRPTMVARCKERILKEAEKHDVDPSVPATMLVLHVGTVAQEQFAAEVAEEYGEVANA
jgi:hypothetical protein